MSDAPASRMPPEPLPRLLVEPPWTRRTSRGTEPVVLTGLKRP